VRQRWDTDSGRACARAVCARVGGSACALECARVGERGSETRACYTRKDGRCVRVLEEGRHGKQGMQSHLACC
jgi:hypothetical protein